MKQRNFTKCSIRVVVILFAFPLFNCVRNRLSSPASRADFLPDSTYLEFGRVYEVEVPQVFSQKNPHQVVQYSVYMCRGGLTDRLLQEITHVEEDTALGNAFVSFVRDFGPALELFKDSSLWLRFEAYADYEDVSVWYYYLVDSTGNCLARNPWVSLHRSRSNGKCALTGIFVNLPDEELMDIPGGLRKK